MNTIFCLIGKYLIAAIALMTEITLRVFLFSFPFFFFFVFFPFLSTFKTKKMSRFFNILGKTVNKHVLEWVLFVLFFNSNFI